jgi:hypothetical protein
MVRETEWPKVDCCRPNHPGGCVCPPREAALRGWIRDDPAIPTMTSFQREACLDEIGSVEGYNRNDHVNDSDIDLARTVLDAWTDYARDKGLL